MYFAANTLWATSDGGRSWKQISPDLTRKTYDLPASVGVYKSDPTAEAKQRGVIYALAVSPKQQGMMWAGTDDGLIWLTTDSGAHWNNVTPPQLSAWQKVSVLEASHTDPQTAYAAVNTLRIDDLHPHIYRTRDSGKSWTEITNGIAENQNVNSVREDTKRKGLLFAGTEGAVYVSFDDGDHWESLRLNLPATSVRDLLIKNDDLAIATHGRGFWILDDITPLRQMWGNSVNGAFLFAPELAYRVHWSSNPDTPLPPDEPAGQNPSDGAILNYYLKAASSKPVTLEILDASSKVVRRYSSADPVPRPNPELPIPEYWVRPYQGLSAAPGFHRFLWDMHYTPVPGGTPDYPISAVEHNTAPTPSSPWIMPGKYTVVLTVDDQKYTQSLTVQMDPRVKTSMPDLQKQFDLSNQLYEDLMALQPVMEKAADAREKLKEMQKTATGAELEKLQATSKELAAIEGGGGRRRRRGAQPENLTGVHDQLLQVFGMLQEVDVAPTMQAAAAVPKVDQSTKTVIQQWKEFQKESLAPLKLQ